MFLNMQCFFLVFCTTILKEPILIQSLYRRKDSRRFKCPKDGIKWLVDSCEVNIPNYVPHLDKQNPVMANGQNLVMATNLMHLAFANAHGMTLES